MKKTTVKKTLTGAAIVAVGAATLANASGIDSMFKPENYKWFENAQTKDNYDYVSGGKEKKNLADQSKDSDRSSGKNDQSVRLASQNLLNHGKDTMEEQNSSLGLTDENRKAASDKKGVSLVPDSGNSTSGNSNGSGNQSGSGSDPSDNRNNGGSDNNGNGNGNGGNGQNGGNNGGNGNNNGGNNDNNNGGNDNNGGNNDNNNGGNDNNNGGSDDNKSSWEETQLKPKDTVETEDGVLLGLKATITHGTYYRGEEFQNEDAEVIATFRKDGKTVEKKLSYGGTNGYQISFSTNRVVGKEMAVFSYKGMSTRAAYTVCQNAVMIGYSADGPDGLYRAIFAATGDAGDPLLTLAGEDTKALELMQAFTKYPNNYPKVDGAVDLRNLHSRMIAYLSNAELKVLMRKATAGNYNNVKFLEESNGYLTKMLSGFVGVENRQQLDDKGYVYYPTYDWGATARSVVTNIVDVPAGYKLRLTTESDGDWYNYVGHQVLEIYDGTDSTMDVPMGVTDIKLTEEASQVKTIKLSEAVDKIDVDSLRENLPNLEEYAYADDTTRFAGNYSIENGLLLSADGSTLIAVPAAKKDIVIPASVKKLAKNCLKGVKADSITFEGTQAPEVSDTTGYEGTIVVPDTQYDSVRKAYQFAFAENGESIRFYTEKDQNDRYSYSADGPMLTYKDPETPVTLAAIDPKANGNVDISDTVQKFGKDSLILPDEVDGITLDEAGVEVSADALGDVSEAGSIPDVKVYVGEENYADYLDAWSKVLDPVYGDGTAEKILQAAESDIIYENGAKYQRITKDGKETYRLLKVYDKSLTQITVKEGTKSIAANAFAGCSSLEILELPESLGTVAADVFAECTSLHVVTTDGSRTILKKSGIADGVKVLEKGTDYKTFTFEDGILYGTKRDGTLDVIRALTTVNGTVHLKEHVVSLEDDAFKDCTAIGTLLIENEKELKNIGESCFENCTSLLTAGLEEFTALKTIGAYAFRNCTTLQTVTLPDTITNVEEGMFYNCGDLVSVSGNELKTIGDEAFASCTSLRTFNSFEKIESFGDRAFYNCNSIQNLEIKNATTSIGEECFANCVKLEKVILNSRLSGISRYCFYGCENLKQVEISEEQKGLLKVIGVEAFSGCSALQVMDLADCTALQQFGERVFAGCTELTTVKFPKVLSQIPDYCFEGCENLSIVQLESTDIIPSGEKSFGEEVLKYLCIRVPAEQLDAYRNAYAQEINSIYGEEAVNERIEEINEKTEWAKGILYENTDEGKVLKRALTTITGEYTIDPATVKIEADAFKGCNGLTGITIPQNTSVVLGDRCFKGCEALEYLVIQGDIPEWGEETFMDCTKLASIYLGTTASKIPRVGTRAFKNCTGLAGTTANAAIAIRPVIDTLGEGCFEGCSNLVAIASVAQFRSNLVTIEDRAFAGCSKLTSFLVSSLSKLTSIGDYAFTECNTITSPSVPVNVKTVGEGCFMNCANLKYVSFYGGVEEYPKNCFKNCPKLIKTGGTAAAFAGLKRIGEGAYEGCTSLQTSMAASVNWALERYSNLESIGANAFTGNTTMSYVKLSGTVKEISAGAFDNCKNVQTITFQSDETPEVGAMALSGMADNLKIVVPGSKVNEDSTFKAYYELFVKLIGEEEAQKRLVAAADPVEAQAQTQSAEEVSKEAAGKTKKAAVEVKPEKSTDTEQTEKKKEVLPSEKVTDQPEDKTTGSSKDNVTVKPEENTQNKTDADSDGVAETKNE